MNLATDGGSAAFLREVKNHLSVENTFVNVKSVREYANENEVPEDIAGGIPGNVVVDKALEYEGDIPISKVSVSPLLLFLHVDQGSFANLGYTPFATLRVNSRSIHKQHVEEAIAEVKDGKPIISQEDIAVTPFEVCLGDSNQEETGSLTYNCTLNRDSQSEVAVMGKRAAVATHEAIDNLYQKVNGGVSRFVFGSAPGYASIFKRTLSHSKSIVFRSIDMIKIGRSWLRFASLRAL
jgi:hypothetical protein